MKKVIYLLSISTLSFGILVNMALGYNAPDYAYYNCPSMEKFSPQMSSYKYCQRPYQVRPCDYTSCMKEYRTLYRPAQKEYMKKQCKESNIRYTESTYGATTCRIEYTTEPTPKILRQSASTISRYSNATDKCLDKLKSSIKKKYPKFEG